MPSKQKNTKLYLETTEVSAAKSIGEITALLVEAGATSIHTGYEDGKPSKLAWTMLLYGQTVNFALPAKVDPVYKVLVRNWKGSTRPRQDEMRARAERIAWRQLLMWVKSQVAMIQLEMVEFGQVFFPYVLAPDQRTTWQHFQESQFKMLEPPKQ